MKAWLMKNKQEAIFTSPQTLRSKVKAYALQSKDQVVTNLRTKYKKEISPADKKTWEEYWDLMGKKGTWVDHIFVQMTAWYMNLDIMILTTSSQSENPFIHLSGNIKETPGNLSGPPLILGNYTNIHYQSLLPQDQQEKTTVRTKKQDPTNQIIPEEEKTEEFIFLQGELTVVFKRLQLGRFECPYCHCLSLFYGFHQLLLYSSATAAADYFWGIG